jgi:uncharacterized protein DUF4337
MAEIEVHQGHGTADSKDPLAKHVGLTVGVIGVVLAVVTIAAHREHTTAVIERTKSNDQWAYYQAKKIREHMSEVGNELVAALATDTARAQAASEKLGALATRYKAEAEEIQKHAQEFDATTERSERKALRFDLGEGFLELGLVLSSLYFLGRQRLFPLWGGLSAVLGLVVALSALLL